MDEHHRRVSRVVPVRIAMAALLSLLLVALVVAGSELLRNQTATPPQSSEASAPSAPPTSAPQTPARETPAPATPAPSPALSATWAPANPLPSLRGGYTAVVMGDGRVLVVGGSDYYDPFEIYDPVSGQWSPSEDRAAIERFESRWDITGISLTDGGALMVAGVGRAGARRWTDVFTPGGSWKRGPRLLRPRAFANVVQLMDGRILVSGGAGYLDTAEIVSLDSGEVSFTGSLSEGRYLAQATLLADGRVLVMGGLVAPGTLTATAEIYDPATGRWSRAARMRDPRKWHTATLMPDGRVLVVGGNQDMVTTLAEVYDPETDTWTVSGEVDSRSGHGAALLADGRVLVVGGDHLRNGTLGTTKVFDPATNTWADGPDLLNPRKVVVLVTLLDGSILVIAGSGRRSTLISEVEILRLGD